MFIREIIATLASLFGAEVMPLDPSILASLPPADVAAVENADSSPSPPDEFLSECLARIQRSSVYNAAPPSRTVVTSSEEWGIVFRADFNDRTIDSQTFVDRAVCSRKDEGKYFVQYFSFHQRPLN